MNNKELLFKSLGHVKVILEYTSNIESYDNFINDPIALDLSLLHFGQIGELCKRFTDDFKKKYGNIDFRAISGLRDIVVHDYSGINYNEIFNTIKTDLPKLYDDYKKILLDDFAISELQLNKFIDSYISTRKFID